MTAFSICQVQAGQRVIVLNSAVSTILKEMDLSSRIVGVTFKEEVFNHATRVGSHLNPNTELIKALQPDLIIAGSKRAFPDGLKDRLGVPLFRYDPHDLHEILVSVRKLGEIFEKTAESQKIITRLQHQLASISQPRKKQTVVFEISQRPLKVAGQQNIVTDIIRAAGGINIIKVDRKHVLLSPEKVLALKPDVYIFQNGPMNKNPVHPLKRSFFKTLKSRIVEVDQLKYTRPGLNAFEAVITLNKLFDSKSY